MRTLFRTERYSGSGTRNAVDVIVFEICELGNTDIPEYCLSHYDFSKMRFNETLQFLIENLENGEMPDETEIRAVVQDMLKHIESQTGHCITHALWLASRETVKDNYEGNEDSIDEYETGPVILSDLGEDGILFGYESNPQKL